MKKFFLLGMSLLFLSTTGMALADAASPTNKVSQHKKHPRGKKPKNTLNPQPLPPRKVPVDGAQAGPGGLKPQ